MRFEQGAKYLFKRKKYFGLRCNLSFCSVRSLPLDLAPVFTMKMLVFRGKYTFLELTILREIYSALSTRKILVVKKLILLVGIQNCFGDKMCAFTGSLVFIKK